MQDIKYRPTLNTYLGQKGYTVLKSELTPVQQNALKQNLIARPITHNSPMQSIPVTFPVYRESPSKIYMPLHYGIKHFGPVKSVKISSGEDINLTFSGELRPQQQQVVNTFMSHVKNNNHGGLLELPCAAGKCLGYNTPVLMYDGTIKMVQDIVVGDKLMGDDSTPRGVKSITTGRDNMYRVYNKMRDVDYIVNSCHILSLKTQYKLIDMELKDYLIYPDKDKLSGYRVPIIFSIENVEIPAYIFGYWISGNSDTLKITGSILNYMQELIGNDLYLHHENDSHYTLKSTSNKLQDFINKYKLNVNRYIPQHYKSNSAANRLYLLAGIIDACGTVITNNNSNNSYIITHHNILLLQDIVYVCRSLGYLTHLQQQAESSVYTLTITGNNLCAIPVNNNILSSQTTIANILDYPINVEHIGIDNYYGFEITGNRRFVLGDFTVTHNTVIGLNIAGLLCKKTLIIVHKEFLMNQWIERINQFLPNTRVGKIQGPVIDIADKDIVIGMLQSISMKEYPVSTFNSFGLTIIDEVHHISSEVFSCALFKIVTKYTLGLSATMNRKDGTTDIFKMFLGDIVYKGEREEQHSVLVRAIEFISDDDDFNKVETDFKGNVKYSTMIVKLCAFNERTEFILRIITDLLIENNNQQIMVLAHNKSILTYLYDAIKHRKIADSSVGYYIGGMKQKALKESETCKIVIATYAMAAEALDIKTLTTLIMATPKTDIEQAVGRILRVKHSKPVVIDIIDNHGLFKNQWAKRKQFYKRQNYKIIQNSNIKYTRDISTWKVVHDKAVINKKIACYNNNDEELTPGVCLL